MRILAMACLTFACGQVNTQIRIDETKGVPPLKGNHEFQIGMSACGTQIMAAGFTVQTKVVQGGCEYSFDKDVPLMGANEYGSIPELKVATSLVQSIELTVKKLTFTDGMMPLDVATRVTSATLSVNGQQVADKATLSNLPKTVSLTGSALDALKSKIDARQAVSVVVHTVVVLPDNPPRPAKLVVDYESQPAIVIGPKKATFP